MKYHKLANNANYSPITILVTANGHVRIFRTCRFSFRALMNDLRRCCPKFTIAAYRDGDVPEQLSRMSFQWVRVGFDIDRIRTVFGGIGIDDETDKAELLRKYPYRTALNMLYLNTVNNGGEVERNPFVGIKTGVKPENPITFKRFPAFISYTDIEGDPWDILTYYDGRRFEKVVNTEPKAGYIITGARWNNGQE